MKEQLLSIGEFARISGINRRNLLFYDQIGLFKPVFTADNGYRYYAYRQIDLLTVILTLQESGMSLQQIKNYMAGSTPETALQLYDRQCRMIRRKIEYLGSIEEMLQLRHQMLKEGAQAQPDQIYVTQCPAYPIYTISHSSFQKGQMPDQVWLDFCDVWEKGNQCYGFPVGYMVSRESLEVHDFCCISKLYLRLKHKKRANSSIPAGTYLITHIYGHYDMDLSDTYEQLLQYAAEHQLQLTGNSYEEYALDEISSPSLDATLLRIAVAVTSLPE